MGSEMLKAKDIQFRKHWCYIGFMTNPKRDARNNRCIIKSDKKSGWAYVTLKDGRKIATPPSGGKLSKSDIEKAVKAVIEDRSTRQAG